MAPRTSVSEAGDWAGVAFVSKYPCRALQVGWPPDLFETGRIQFCTSFVDPFWLTGGVVYGYPQGVTHPGAHEHTMDMLSFAVQHLTQSCVGPRFLGGDWNFEPHMVAVWEELQHLGWVEVQDLREKQLGVRPQATCKFKTRKDFMWLSPELVRHFVSLDFLDLFADHSVMCANFTSPGVMVERWLWTRPSPIEWQGVPDIPHSVDFANVDPSDAYGQLWTFREAQAKAHLGDAWHQHMAGRAQQRAPKYKKGWPTPFKRVDCMIFSLNFLVCRFNTPVGSNNFGDSSLIIVGLPHLRFVTVDLVTKASPYGIASCGLLDLPLPFKLGGFLVPTGAQVTCLASLISHQLLTLHCRSFIHCLPKFEPLSKGYNKPVKQ